MVSRKLRPSPIPEPLSGGQLPVAQIQSPRFRRLSVILHFMAWALGMARLYLTGQFTRRKLYVSVRELIEKLSGLWVKAGQIMSLRIDLFPVEFCRELAKLQNRATGFPVEQLKAILTAELGRPIDEVFSYFSDKPLAAASIGQVHRARLRVEDCEVAVKVQRPNIATIYARDLDLIKLFVAFLKLVDFMPHMRWHEISWEIEQVMTEELDYRYEGAYARKMRKALRVHGLHAPKIFRNLTTKRLLVMEFIDGVLMSDYLHLAGRDPQAAAIWRQENDVDPTVLATKLLDSLMRQVFEENMFHGDLHPGNILILKGGNVAVIDFGTCGFTEAAFMDKWRELFKTFGTRDFARIVDIYFLICSSSPAIDLRPIREEIIQRVHEWARRTGVPELPFGEKSVDNIAVTITKILAVHKFELGWSYLRIRRAVTALDASVMELYPGIDYPGMSRQHFTEAMQRSLTKLVSNLPSETARALSITGDVGQRFNETFTMQMAGMRQQIQVMGGDILKIGDMMLAMMKRVAVASAVLGASILWHWYAPPSRPHRAGDHDTQSGRSARSGQGADAGQIR